jgi:hypothetical protein
MATSAGEQRMDDPGTFGIVIFFGAAFSASRIGAVVARLTRFEVGMATGLLIMSVGGLVGATRLTLINLENAKGTVIATGKLVEYGSETSSTTDSSGRTTSTRSYGPLVEFTAADGKAYRVKGLGSSSQSLGSAPPCRCATCPPIRPRRSSRTFRISGLACLRSRCSAASRCWAACFSCSRRSAGRARDADASVRDAVPPRWVAWCESRGKQIGGYLNMIAATRHGRRISLRRARRRRTRSRLRVRRCGRRRQPVRGVLLISNGGWQAVFMCGIIAAGFGAFGIGTVLLTQPAADAMAAKTASPAASASRPVSEDFSVCAGNDGNCRRPRSPPARGPLHRNSCRKEKLAKTFHSRGVEWIGKGDYDRAIADYDEAIRLDPQDPLAYYNRGVAWHGKHDYDRAIADYDEAIRPSIRSNARALERIVG